jgi:hypothetical protein
VPNGTPALIAEAPHAARQSAVPRIATDGVDFAWRQGVDGDHGAVMRWRPGEAHPVRLYQDDSDDLITVDHGYVYEEVHQQGRNGGPGPSDVYQTRLDGSQRTKVASITDNGFAAVRDGTIAYFGPAADQPGQVWLLRIGSDVQTAVAAYPDQPEVVEYVRWLDDGHLVVVSESGGGQIIDVARHSVVSTVPRRNAGEPPTWTIPTDVIRTETGYADIVLADAREQDVIVRLTA